MSKHNSGVYIFSNLDNRLSVNRSQVLSAVCKTSIFRFNLKVDYKEFIGIFKV